jgi:hypothetical protein
MGTSVLEFLKLFLNSDFEFWSDQHAASLSVKSRGETGIVVKQKSAPCADLGGLIGFDVPDIQAV